MRDTIGKVAPILPKKADRPNDVSDLATGGSPAASSRLPPAPFVSATGRVDRVAVTTPKREMDVELVVQWTYRVQMADLARTGMGGSISGSTDSVAELGVGVDRSSYTNVAVHEDAYRVHEQVERLPSEIQSPIITHGRLATRPDWMPGVISRPKPLREFDGKPTVLSSEPQIKRAGWYKTKWCPLVWTPPAESIEQAHDRYLIWWGSLLDLAERLRSVGLTSITVLDPSAPRFPWLDSPPRKLDIAP